MSETKQCQNCKADFIIADEDFDFYEKIKVPSPTFCPECRMQRRMAYRNERHMYRDNCDLCGKAILSMFTSDKPFTVYCRECWYSDKWDSATYCREYDFSKSFFEQFYELMKVVPRIGFAYIGTAENADYANYLRDAKDVYLSFSVSIGERIFYSRTIDKSKDVFDSLNVKQSEKNYWCVESASNYNCAFLFRSRNCLDCSFLFDCVNCQNCFMCSNMRNKQFCFRNKQYSQEQYERLRKQLDFGYYDMLIDLQREFLIMIQNSIHKFSNVVKSLNSSGDNLENTKNCKLVFDVYDVENTKYSARQIGTRDSYDIYSSNRGELLYEGSTVTNDANNCQFIMVATCSSDSIYSDWCLNCSNVFGSIGLKKKEYCILNKQYTKDDYFALKSEIIEHMNKQPYVDKVGRVYKFGEFFPITLLPFAYNESIAQEYFPLTKEQALSNGFLWHDDDHNIHASTINSSALPSSIKDVDEGILKEVIKCEQCKKCYKVIKAELSFLREMSIALPRKCPDCRHAERFAMKNPLKLWHKKCGCGDGNHQNVCKHFHGQESCPNEFETPYAPDRPEIVYCEQCYQSEVV